MPSGRSPTDIWRPAGWIFQPFGRSVTPLPWLPGQDGGAGPRWATDATAATMTNTLKAQMARKGLERMGGF